MNNACELKKESGTVSGKLHADGQTLSHYASEVHDYPPFLSEHHAYEPSDPIQGYSAPQCNVFGVQLLYRIWVFFIREKKVDTVL